MHTFAAPASNVICVGVENPGELTPYERSYPRPTGNGCSGDYGGFDSIQQHLHLYRVPYPHHPPGCEHFDVPTLSMDLARNTLYWIYDSNYGWNLVNVILEQLDRHPLSITLFAIVARQNRRAGVGRDGDDVDCELCCPVACTLQVG